MKRHVAEAGRKDVFLDAEAEKWREQDDERDEDGEDLSRELEHDAEPDNEVQKEKAEGVDEGAVANFGGEGLDVGEGVVRGFAEVLEGF